jgi:pimeloyl-ACP methyl ester carboxylesterase
MIMGKKKQQKKCAPINAGVGGVLSVVVGVVGGWILYSALGIDHELPLPPALDADQERLKGENSRFLNYYVDRSAEARPLVLVHSINAAASAYEMRPIFEHYRGKRRVYALDLPGFGFSERADRVYSPDLYADAIIDLLEQRVGEPADVVALSLGSEFAARAALRRPDLFHSLSMISPSGFTSRENKRVSQQANDQGSSDFVYNLLAMPLWSQAFYDLLTSRRGIQFFLNQSFEGAVDAGLSEYAYLTTHQPGARYAPLYFVSGKLFTRDARVTLYEPLTIPVLVLHDRDAFVRFDMLPEVVARHDNWRSKRIAPTRGLLHFEKMPEAAQAFDEFWGELE